MQPQWRHQPLGQARVPNSIATQPTVSLAELNALSRPEHQLSLQQFWPAESPAGCTAEQHAAGCNAMACFNLEVLWGHALSGSMWDIYGIARSRDSSVSLTVSFSACFRASSGCAACSKNMFHASEKGKVEYTKQLSESLEQRGLRLETTYFLSSLALMAPIHTVFTYFVKQRALVAIFGVKPGRDTQPFTQLCQSSGPYGILMVGSSHKPAQAHRHMCAS